MILAIVIACLVFIGLGEWMSCRRERAAVARADSAGYSRGRRDGEAIGRAEVQGRRAADVVSARLPATESWGEVVEGIGFELQPPEHLSENDRREWWERFHGAADARWEEIRGRRATERGEAS